MKEKIFNSQKQKISLIRLFKKQLNQQNHQFEPNEGFFTKFEKNKPLKNFFENRPNVFANFSPPVENYKDSTSESETEENDYNPENEDPFNEEEELSYLVNESAEDCPEINIEDYLKYRNSL